MQTVAVLVPYKITLLSNPNGELSGLTHVLVPYKITLLSNAGSGGKYVCAF